LKISKGSRGQAVIIDFSVALMLFILMWFFITSQFNAQFADAIHSQSVDSMRLKADYTLETLVKSPGTPSNWENHSPADVNSIGLAVRDREISEEKLTAFSNFSGSYDELRQKMGIGDVDFFFTFDGVDDATAGLPPGGDADKVTAQRIVMYKGGSAIVTLMLYRLA